MAQTQLRLPPPLHDLLTVLRARRGFEAERYIDAKTWLLNRYFQQNNLSACVVGVSGGVDSAVTLALLVRASKIANSPIRHIVPALLPMHVRAGATNQQTATNRGAEVAAALGCTAQLIDLSKSLDAMRDAVEQGMGRHGTPWAQGQLVSYHRTPALYYAATLLTDAGTPATVVGTTNRDEGAYIGFFGKASDGMVDIQPISDIHKSEVYSVASKLGVPQSVLQAVPTGDTFDGRFDVQMIGAPYDFVELHALCRTLLTSDALERLKATWDSQSRAQFETWSTAIEELHHKNLHKYLGASPAVHLDVYPREVPSALLASRESAPVDRSRFVGLFEAPKPLVEMLEQSTAPGVHRAPIADCGDSAHLLSGVLSEQECLALRKLVENQSKLPTGLDGRTDSYSGQGNAGSLRASIFDEAISRALWRRLSRHVPMLRRMSAFTPTDCGGESVWTAVGLNPLFRFIWYEPGGSLVPHYDAGIDLGRGRHTLMSVIFYLTPPGKGGATRLLVERQRHLPVAERQFVDATQPANDSDVLVNLQPSVGSVLVFDHRMPHEAQVWEGPGPRIILRTDVIFERAGHSAGLLPDAGMARSKLSPKNQLSHDSEQTNLFSSPFTPREVEGRRSHRPTSLDCSRDERNAPFSPIASHCGSSVLDERGVLSPKSPAEVGFAAPDERNVSFSGVSRANGPSAKNTNQNRSETHDAKDSDLELWKLLNLTPNASTAQIDKAAREAHRQSQQPRDVEYAWKALRDPYYASAYRLLRTKEAIEDAGFFEDSSPFGVNDVRRDPRWMVTPLHKIVQRFNDLTQREENGESLKPLAVLVSTGGFSPIHQGHIKMMELAREEMERQGFNVLGGYISPSHDQYVLPKCNHQVPHAPHRIRLCELAVESIDWLMVDPWEALYCDVAVNFTDVLTRLEQYLSTHLNCHRPVEVVYVFGSDNARFSLTFVDRGRAVCVTRPGFEKSRDHYAAHPLVKGNARITMLEAPSTFAASADIREGRDSALVDEVRSLWRSWRKQPSDEKGYGVLFVRDEGSWAAAPWFSDRNEKSLELALGAFRDGILRLLKDVYAKARRPDIPCSIELQIQNLEVQLAQAKALLQGEPFISLDPCLPGTANLGVSRSFEVAADVSRGPIARPGCPELSEQLKAIEPGEYVLVDDDRSTGRTLRETLELLKARCVVKRTVLLCETDTPSASRKDEAPLFVDLVDVRDFLAGSRDGGLVVILPTGKIARAPYALPYVRPSGRICIPLSNEKAFSREVWKLNAAFFAQVQPTLTLQHASTSFRALCAHAGFTAEHSMEEVCAWHAQRLEDLN